MVAHGVFGTVRSGMFHGTLRKGSMGGSTSPSLDVVAARHSVRCLISKADVRRTLHGHVCAGSLVILAARGIVSMWDMQVLRYWAAPVALAAVILLSVSGITRYFRHNDLGDWRTAVSYIADRTKPGDGAIFWIPDTHSYSYYARGRAVPDVLYPDDPWHPLSLEEIANITSARTRVWLILYGEADDPDQVSFLKSSLAIDFHLQKEQTVSAQYPITIALYERKSTVAAE
jgi:hypothetical protein